MSDAGFVWPEPIRRALSDYYRGYYHDDLRLPDWEQRIVTRQTEESVFAAPIIDRMVRWSGIDLRGKKVLVVGAGTGAEVFEFVRRGADVFGLEPNPEGLRIMRLKADHAGFATDGRLVEGVAERLPFDAGSFDLVYSFTVLEHVKNVAQSIDEMLRVCRDDGVIFIETPNYRFPYEGHYKMALIPFAPKWLQRLYLRARGRYTPFFETINFVTDRGLDRLFWARNVTTMRIAEPHLLLWPTGKLNTLLAKWFGIQKNQYILLRKGWK